MLTHVKDVFETGHGLFISQLEIPGKRTMTSKLKLTVPHTQSVVIAFDDGRELLAGMYTCMVDWHLGVELNN